MKLYFYIYLALIQCVCEFRKAFVNPLSADIQNLFPKKYFLNGEKYYFKAFRNEDVFKTLEICKNCIKILQCKSNIEKTLKSLTRLFIRPGAALLCYGIDNYSENGLILLSDGKKDYFLGVNNNKLVLFYKKYYLRQESKLLITENNLGSRAFNSVPNLIHFEIAPLEKCFIGSSIADILDIQKHKEMPEQKVIFDFDHEVDFFSLSSGSITFKPVKEDSDSKSMNQKTKDLDGEDITFETKL